MEGHLQTEFLYIMPISLLLGLVAGFVMHRSDFCVAGFIRDVFMFHNYKKMKFLFVLVIVAMTLFEVSRLSGLLSAYPFPTLSAPSLGNLIGGFLFGIGMTLSGGCVVGVLYKIGSGSVLALVALIGILFGSAFYAEIHEAWVIFIKSTILTKNITLTQLLNISPTIPVFVVTVVGFYFIFKWYRANEFKISHTPKGYVHPAKTAVVLAFLGLLSYIFIGVPLGITTSYAKTAGFLESLVLPSHFQVLSYFKLVSHDFSFPLTGNRITGGPAPLFDAVAAIQYPLITGIIVGSFISAVSLKEFKIHFKSPFIQYLSAFVGGFILGLSSRLAQGCNIWHFFGGLPIFNLQSIVFSIAILPGVWLGSKILMRFIIK